MNELYITVRQALDELIIHPLQNIVNALLPDRAILSSYHLFGIASTNKGKLIIDPEDGGGGWMALRGDDGSVAGAAFLPVGFQKFTLDLSPFFPLYHSTPHPDFTYYYSVTIVYFGEPEIIQIERRKDYQFFPNRKPEYVWTRDTITPGIIACNQRWTNCTTQ